MIAPKVELYESAAIAASLPALLLSHCQYVLQFLVFRTVLLVLGAFAHDTGPLLAL
jgi:hypothetical protein